jgi:hypothetical protein
MPEMATLPTRTPGLNGQPVFSPFSEWMTVVAATVRSHRVDHQMTSQHRASQTGQDDRAP